MLIQLKQTELEAAIAAYIALQGLSISNKKISVTFTAGRGASGYTADVELEPADNIDLNSLRTNEFVVRESDIQDPAEETKDETLFVASTVQEDKESLFQ